MLAINSTSPITQLKKWSATVVANVLSTYALDTVSTVAGVLLVASGFFASTGLPFVLFLLGCSYVLWGAGLSSSLRANWRLLEATGTSTSLLSKLAYDLGRLRTNARIRRILCASGYVAFELAKNCHTISAPSGLRSRATQSPARKRSSSLPARTLAQPPMSMG